ncbi:P-loop NTPase fold protein [Piscirickettsia litoralis]|uniref:KAP NTPase domain-containing protein n=1 Tax=Piscirickettsia litoralis TaxID=1891921 RepID=A0ABX2ZXU9_9GAMM|nr:P-loop NTPase fold protein [Piscirickettsia litoralis]ODN41308.1 hypothetical protein BGC07_17245 [Piscirickettsia litoralis]
MARITLLNEEPSKADLFDCNSHENVAKAMASFLKEENAPLLGLSGDLGSGKSTVLKLLEKELASNDLHFIYFDIEQYQYGSTKRALIELVYSELKGLNKRKCSKLAELRDQATGNWFKYKKQTKSELSGWVVLFIISVLFSSQSIGSFIKSIETGHFRSIGFWINLIILSSPALIAIAAMLSGKKLGDLVKRNSLDTIDEKILVTKEIGPIELKQAFSGFMEYIPEGKKIIIVFDNLDRVSMEKAKEVWADLELLANIAKNSTNNQQDRLKIILPFSPLHVAKSIINSKSDSSIGDEFIAKRLPVCFRVPQASTAGWKKMFLTLWSEALGDNNDCANETILLIERWQNTQKYTITPRFIKRLINDISISTLSLSFKSKIKNTSISYYLISNRYCALSLYQIIGSSDATESSKDYHDILEKSQHQMDRYYGDRETWVDQVLCLHYLVEPKYAKAELLNTPIEQAIETNNVSGLVDKIGIYGFKEALIHAIEKRSIIPLIKFYYSFLELEKDINKLSQVIELRVYKLIPASSNENVDKFVDQELLESFSKAKELNQKIIAFVMNKIESAFIDIITSDQSKDTFETTSSVNLKDIDNSLQIINGFCELSSKDLLTKNIHSVSPESIMKYFISNDGSDRFQNLPLKEIISSNKLFSLIDISIKSDEKEWLILNRLSQAISLGSQELQSIREDGRYEAYIGLSSYTNLKQHIPITDVNLTRCYPFSKSWSHTNLINQFYILIGKLPDQESKDEMTAQLFCQLLSSTVFKEQNKIQQISQHLQSNGNYHKYLKIYISYIPSFSQVCQSFCIDFYKNNSHYTDEVLNKIKNNQIEIDTRQLISSDYSNLRKAYKLAEISSIFKSNSIFDEITSYDVDSIDESLLDDILSDSILQEIKASIIGSFLNQELNFDEWADFITNPHTNYQKVINELVGSDHKLENSSFRKFLANYYEDYELDLTKNMVITDMIEIMKREDQQTISRVFRNLLNRNDIDIKIKVQIILDCSKVLHLEINPEGVISIIDYIENSSSIDKKHVYLWLDQKISQNDVDIWNSNQLTALNSVYDKNIELFPETEKADIFSHLTSKGNST